MNINTDRTSSPAFPKVAFLGPAGTYSHQCARDKFGTNVEYVEQPNISAIFDVLSEEIPYAVVPQQNSTFGSVIETYDNLRRDDIGQRIHVKGEITISIQHCLAVRSGIRPEGIKRIVSHEQALGQCAQYLSTHYPDAVRHKAPSTGQAALSLLRSDEVGLDDESELQTKSAAICSVLCAKMNGLEIVQENIQDRNNFTRFYVLSIDAEAKPPQLPESPQLFRALIRLESVHVEGHDLFARRPLQLVMGTLLTTFGVPTTRIDRRPSLNSTPFEDVYFIELEELGAPDYSIDRSGVYASWLHKVHQMAERARSSGVYATLLGVW
ncbi:PDT-domain-containing protein [Cristinia sonorae]|uniref:prephenate dehydratase n=1 Tax=Cristinia sonorae TaxID=1940300 RepID=A0A8K0XRM5_9AGAR|nr:PDT-domain-containing protein [Cristinia sonorae]